MPRTKIVCTIGPASESPETIEALIRAGMNAARINFSHGDHEEHADYARRVRDSARGLGALVPIIGDLQGPKFRIGEIEGGEVLLRVGEEVVLTGREVPGSSGELHLPHPELIRGVAPGGRLLLDDGNLELSVLETAGEDLRCRVVNGGSLRSRKGISAPDADLQLTAITPRDRADVEFAVRQDLDFLALSFVRGPEDVRGLRELLRSHGSAMPIISKIEKPQAVERFDEILKESNAVMIARGDLGVEVAAERVPFIQKDLIRRSNDAGVPVITATQMLVSMIDNPRPTRAEASDIANAILDGTSAVMLSGETTIGKHPVESVETMARIAAHAEGNIPYDQWIFNLMRLKPQSPAEAISQATVRVASELGARAIVTSTYSGRTARLVAGKHPRTPVIAITPEPRVQSQLALAWGVTPKRVPVYDTTDRMIELASRAAIDSGLAGPGDTIVITAGIPPGGGAKTNLLKIHVIPR